MAGGPRKKRARRPLQLLAVAAAAAFAGGAGAFLGERAGQTVQLLEHTTAVAYQRAFRDNDLQAWHSRVPATEVVRVRSSVDGHRQRMIWYHSGSKQPRPLLVALHSWSADYEQNLNIPYAEFAIANDWVFLHPDFRGPNKRPEATASDLAVQDVIDAVAFARKRAAVDDSRIYLVGYSGGAMKALVLAGRHPQLWAGVAAWGAIYDIADWYRHRHDESKHYRREIVASCGGAPRAGTSAASECRERSPSAQLAPAAGRVPILIAHGIEDQTVPVRHALGAYDTLAAADERFTAEERAVIEKDGRIPPQLSEVDTSDPRLIGAFDRAGAPVRLKRRSRAVTLVLYEGGHDMVYNAALHWLNQQRRRR